MAHASSEKISLMRQPAAPRNKRPSAPAQFRQFTVQPFCEAIEAIGEGTQLSTSARVKPQAGRYPSQLSRNVAEFGGARFLGFHRHALPTILPKATPVRVLRSIKIAPFLSDFQHDDGEQLDPGSFGQIYLKC